LEDLSIINYLVFFLGSFIISLAFTPLVRRWALMTRRVAVPKDSRWHKKETALLGGVSIYVSTMAVWVLSVAFMDWKNLSMPYLPVMLCSTAVFALGLADDILNMDPQHKLAAQFVIASILLFFGFRLEWTVSETANLFISLIWIVGITNAFNLLDNMDGLSAGIALIAGTFIFLTYYLNPVIGISTGHILIMCSAYLGSLLGFLVYNFNPASIFMGDAGSLFIGFFMGCLTVMGGDETSVGSSAGHTLSVIAIPILIVFIPILDTGFVSLMRKLFRRPISQGGKDHSSHRMVAIGFSERKAVLVLYAFSIASGLIALAINYLNIGLSLTLIVFYLLFVIFFWIYLAKVKVYPEKSILSEDRRISITPILIEITYRRRLFEVLLDLVLITVAYYTAYLLRFEGVLGGNFEFFLRSLPIIIACQFLSSYLFRLYRGAWESTGLSDLIDYIKAITAGSVSAILILLFIYRFYSFSRAVFIIYWILMLIMMSLSRLSFRLLDEGLRKGDLKGRPTLIYGAGVGGQMVVRELESNRSMGLTIAGFIDDDPRKHKGRVMGYPVMGGLEELGEIIKSNQIQEIIISFKAQGEERQREIKQFCRNSGLEISVHRMRLIID
jgi:UDP-GlcNAc:undecaprenyl-phosphate GlcNAc-1-phosphate transferase